MKPEEIVIMPVVTEAVLEMIERENKLVFFVKRSANRKSIKTPQLSRGLSWYFKQSC